MTAEGWYHDPFDLHTDRWISDGTPTALVRDAGVESYDEPPSTALTRELVESEHPAPHTDDLLRSGDPAGAGQPFTPHDTARAVVMSAASAGIGVS